MVHSGHSHCLQHPHPHQLEGNKKYHYYSVRPTKGDDSAGHKMEFFPSMKNVICISVCAHGAVFVHQGTTILTFLRSLSMQVEILTTFVKLDFFIFWAFWLQRLPNLVLISNLWKDKHKKVRELRTFAHSTKNDKSHNSHSLIRKTFL